MFRCQVLSLTLVFEVVSVFKQQILSGFILLAGFVIFTVSDLIDNAVKIGDHMKQVEYDFGLRHFFLTALRVPHVHDHSFDAGALLGADIEKLHECIGLAIFADKYDAAAEIIQYHSQITMTFAD